MRRPLRWILVLGFSVSACARVSPPEAGPTIGPTAGPSPTVHPALQEGAPPDVVIAIGHTLVISSESGEVLRRLAQNPVGGDVDVELSADRSTVYIGRELTAFAETPSRSAIVRVPFEGGDIETLVELDGLIGGMALSPDHRKLAYSVSNGPSEGAYVRDLATGEETRIERLPYFDPTSFSPDSKYLAGFAEVDGRRGVEVLDVSVSPPARHAFLAPEEPRYGWLRALFAGSSQEIVVHEEQCFRGIPEPCEAAPAFDLVLDVSDGSIIESRPARRWHVSIRAFDNTATHPLFGMEPARCIGDYCSHFLLRLDDRDRLVQIAEFYDADW